MRILSIFLVSKNVIILSKQFIYDKKQGDMTSLDGKNVTNLMFLTKIKFPVYESRYSAPCPNMYTHMQAYKRKL